MTKFGSWGNLVKTEHQIEYLQDAYNLPETFNDFKEENKGNDIHLLRTRAKILR